MASIDKIYGTDEQYDIFYDWCLKHNKTLLLYFYPKDDVIGNIRPITNTPVHVDIWLWNNCDLDFVKERLREMYDGEPKIINNDDILDAIEEKIIATLNNYKEPVRVLKLKYIVKNSLIFPLADNFGLALSHLLVQRKIKLDQYRRVYISKRGLG